MKPLATRIITERLGKASPQLEEFTGRVFTQDALPVFCSIAARLCARKGASLTEQQLVALKSSTEHLIGKTPDIQMLRANMHRLIANWHFIAEGMAIPTWQGELTDADAVFIGVKRMPVGEGARPKYRVKIKLKSGLCAGIINWSTLYEAALYNFVDHKAGTGKYKCAPEEISGMEARLLVTMTAGQLKIMEWSCTQAQKDHNRQLAELRSDISKCRLTQPCNTCTKTILQCPLAVWLPKE